MVFLICLKTKFLSDRILSLCHNLLIIILISYLASPLCIYVRLIESCSTPGESVTTARDINRIILNPVLGGCGGWVWWVGVRGGGGGCL